MSHAPFRPWFGHGLDSSELMNVWISTGGTATAPAGAAAGASVKRRKGEAVASETVASGESSATLTYSHWTHPALPKQRAKASLIQCSDDIRENSFRTTCRNFLGCTLRRAQAQHPAEPNLDFPSLGNSNQGMCHAHSREPITQHL